MLRTFYAIAAACFAVLYKMGDVVLHVALTGRELPEIPKSLPGLTLTFLGVAVLAAIFALMPDDKK